MEEKEKKNQKESNEVMLNRSTEKMEKNEMALEENNIKKLHIQKCASDLVNNSRMIFVGLIDPETGKGIVKENFMNLEYDAEYDFKESIEKEALCVAKDHREQFLKDMTLENISEKIRLHGRYELRCRLYSESHNKELIVVLHFCNYQDETKQYIMGVIEDITDKISRDDLTGVYNMNGFIMYVNQCLKASKRNNEYAVVGVNVRNFKGINKHFGYYAGDKVLCELANWLKSSGIYPEKICRDISDQFFCIVKSENLSEKKIENLCKFQIVLDNHPVALALNCGIYYIDNSIDRDVAGICDCIRIAQKDGSEEKTKAYHIYDETMDQKYMSEVSIQQEFEKALSEKQFMVYYQPIFDAQTKKVVSAEALIRWVHPERGIISPGEFISVLEKNGDISDLDFFVQNEVTKHMEDSLAKGHPIVPVAVNLSRVDLFRKEVVSRVLNKLYKTKISKKYFKFEVTESAFVDIPDIGEEFLRRLTKMGCPIMIDDFGSGYSSLGSLVTRKFDVVKLDMAFIQRIGKDKRAEAVISSAILMSHQLGANVIAEGVETEEQYQFLLKVECDYIQGYYFSKPLPREEYERLLDVEAMEDNMNELHKKWLLEMRNKEIGKNVASGLSELYFGIYYIDLVQKTFICYRENLENVSDAVGAEGDYVQGFTSFVNNFVVESCQKDMYDFVNLETLKERLKTQKAVSEIYQQKDGGWTKGRFIACEYDAKGEVVHAIFVISDISKEMAAKKKRIRAEREAIMDPMTKVYNRKGFAKCVSEKEFASNPVGMILLDIDRFKEINDSHGHEIGDEVLKDVAAQLGNAFRQSDMIFRFGGDEFIVLLKNCTQSIWENLCEKFSEIHTELLEKYGDEIPVTMSGGVCFMADGYDKKMYQMADDALYYVKSNGRGGIALIGQMGDVEKYWHDDNTSLRMNKILVSSYTGTWRMEIYNDPNKLNKMYCDETLKNLLDVSSDVAPEEMYKKWVGGILEEDVDLVRKAMKEILKNGRAEVTYYWKHPENGQELLRSGGSFEAELKDGVSIYGYLQELKDTIIVQKKEE